MTMTVANVVRALERLVVADTANDVVATWDTRMAVESAGLDFSDPEDRATFRGSLYALLKNAKLAVVEQWLAARAPGLKMPHDRLRAIRLMADVYMKHVPVPQGVAAPAPRKPAEPKGGDVTARLSKRVRDAGFTLISTVHRDTETGGVYYEYDLRRHGEPVSFGGSKAYRPTSIAAAEMAARRLLDR